jgi:hypothetical protein
LAYGNEVHYCGRSVSILFLANKKKSTFFPYSREFLCIFQNAAAAADDDDDDDESNIGETERWKKCFDELFNDLNSHKWS